MKRMYLSHEVQISDFVAFVMNIWGIDRNLYDIRHNCLRIKKYPIRGALLTILKEQFPQYNFYWETPRVLKWF